MSCSQVTMRPSPAIFRLLILLLLVSGCAPRQAVQNNALSNKPRLLAASDFVSKITVIHAPQKFRPEQQGEPASQWVDAIHEGGEKIVALPLSERVYTHAETGVQRETKKQLLKTGRWKDGGGVELHLRITHLRLRRTAAQLLLYLVAGHDEMGARVSLIKDGKVFASDTVSTRMASGGVYGTFTLSKRVNMLSQQLARKLVRSRL